jgi:sugar phosphate isomerase/epimerase
MTWSFGVSEVTTQPWTFEQDLSRYAVLGVAAIEIWEQKLDADRGRRREQLQQPAAAGLTVCSFQAQMRALFPTQVKPEPRAFDARLHSFIETLEAFAPALPGAVFVLNSGVAEHGDVDRAFRCSAAAFAELARRADALGVRLALEPLHPLAMNEDSFVWNLEDALELVEAADHPALGICADIWNLAGQADLQRRLARCGDRIFLAQVSDWRRPRSYLDRLPIGDGSLNFRPFLDGLRGAGYRGPLVLEIFSQNVRDSLYDGDLNAVIARSRDALERIAAEAAA